MTIQPRIILSEEVGKEILIHIFDEIRYEVLFDQATNTFTLIKKP